MNGQNIRLPHYRQIAGAVQIPLVLLVWGALVLFFGHQYQANALLPSGAKHTDLGSAQTNELMLAQQRSNRLLAELAAQAPAQLPNLLDPKAFAPDLAAALAYSDLGQGAWRPGRHKPVLKPDHVPEAASDVVPEAVSDVVPSVVVKVVPEVVPEVEPEFIVEVVQVVPAIVPAVVPAAEQSTFKAAKFVRLPAVVQTKALMRVDKLRVSKDRARAELLSGNPRSAYQRLRGQIASGRTDIEFLGLLALASLQQQPQEAEVIYRHLMQLQPDSQRWRQGLEQTQRLLAAGANVKGDALQSKSSAALQIAS